MSDELLLTVPDKGARVDVEERDYGLVIHVRDDAVPANLVSQMLGAVCMGVALCACIPLDRVVVNRPKGTTGALSCRIPLPRERPRAWREHHVRIAGTVAATTLTAWGYDVQVKEEVHDGQPAAGA